MAGPCCCTRRPAMAESRSNQNRRKGKTLIDMPSQTIRLTEIWLYTAPGCHACETAKKMMEGRIYREVSLSDPITKAGMMATFGRLMAPILAQSDGTFYHLAGDENSPVWAKIILRT